MTQVQLSSVLATNSTHKDAAQTLLSNLEAVNTKPLWAQMSKLNPPLPNPSTVPHVWRYDEIRPHLLRAGELVTEKQAERRVLMLVNPARSKSKPPSLLSNSANQLRTTTEDL